jgi:hypothetical protein
MPARRPTASSARSALARTALLAGFAIAAMPALAQSQQVGGALGASLTILKPVTTQPVRVTGFTVGRDGVARLETTAPTTAHASQLVMATVASSTSGFAPVEQIPALVAGADDATRLSYRLDVGRASGEAGRPVELRIQYLTVAGT